MKGEAQRRISGILSLMLHDTMGMIAAVCHDKEREKVAQDRPEIEGRGCLHIPVRLLTCSVTSGRSFTPPTANRH